MCPLGAKTCPSLRGKLERLGRQKETRMVKRRAMKKRKNQLLWKEFENKDFIRCHLSKITLDPNILYFMILL